MNASTTMLAPPPRVNILGVGLSAMNMDQAVKLLLDAASTRGFSGYVTVTGVHGVMESQDDDDLKRIHNRSFLSTPDGMPMVWCGKWEGHAEMSRVYGPDLMERVIEASPPRGLRHFLFGGKEGVAEQLKLALCNRFSALEIVGTETPPFRPLEAGEEQSLADRLEELRPHFFWVGLSTPKQEKFMAGFLRRHPNLTRNWDHGLIFLGVGAAFDFHSGGVKQAPSWIQQSGLEWAFRLMMEPKRLWRRYLKNNPRFLVLRALQMSGVLKFKMEN